MALRADDVDLGRDRALVVRFQSGDDTAFDDLYRRYFARLRRFCERRVGDPHEAEELAQEAFTKALRAMPDFAGERRFYPWMTVIASRLCVDSHRRRQRSTPVAEVDLGCVEPDLDELFAEVDRADLQRALERLAPRHREVLELRERDGWSYQRIADHYDVTLGTVEALLHRARRALRREFTKVTRGDHVGALAGIPGVAWVLRRLDSLRVRATQLGDIASPLSATVASVALAAGSVAVFDARVGDGPTPPPAISVVAVDAPRLTASSTTVAAPPAPAAAAAPAVSGAPQSAPDAIGTTPAPTGGHLELSDADHAREVTADAPVRHEIAGVGGVAFDPQAAVDAVTRRLLPLLGGNQ